MIEQTLEFLISDLRLTMYDFRFAMYDSPAVYGRGESPIPLLCPSAQISKGSLMTPLPFRMYYLFIVLYQ